MSWLAFEWDDVKNEINRKIHGISFEEARSVFDDKDALLISDPEHSEEEARFITLGYGLRANLLVVCHCYRDQDSVISIISARKATVKETRQYNDLL